MKNKYIIVALALIVLVGAGGLVWFIRGGHLFIKPTASSATPDAAAVVATFHDGATKITRGELDTQVQTLAKNPQIQVPDASKVEERKTFERLVIEQMIKDTLLFDEAKKQELTADDAAVDKELATITARYKDVAAFEAALVAAQLNKETLRENIRHQLIINQYYNGIAATHNVTVTPVEVKAFYDTQVVPTQPKLAFADVEKEIQTRLEQQKTQGIVTGILDELYKSANVQILI